MLGRQVSVPVEDWNVVVTTFDGRGLRHARRFLGRYGEVSRTIFHNVLVLKVPDTTEFLQSMAEAMRTDARMLNDISRMAPAQAVFEFATADAFEEKARAVALGWADRLRGSSFHARLNQRRGAMPLRLSSLATERAINEAILRELVALGDPGRIEFDDPDYTIDIETVGNRAGMSIWSRADRKEFPFLRPD